MTAHLPYSYQLKFCAYCDPDFLHRSVLNAFVLKEIVGIKFITVAMMKLNVGPTLHYNKKEVLKLSAVTYIVREIETACGMERDLLHE
jgi:hypothetical protein